MTTNFINYDNQPFLVRLIEKNGGKAPLTYRQFQNIIASMEQPPPPEHSITADYIGRGYTPMDYDMDDRYSVPTLEELGEYSAHNIFVKLSFFPMVIKYLINFSRF